uniref:Endoribonuclease n=2 Tax=Strongyloides stercoralis TaxID=6248 RepID=A0A0K0EA51_STRER
MLKLLLFIFLFSIFFFFTKQQSLPQVMVTDKEISDLVQLFFDSDENAATNDQIVLNYQNHTTSRDNNGFASLPLFTEVDPTIAIRPTFKAYYQLMDNYNPEVGKVETYSEKKEQEIDTFLYLITNTTIGKHFFMFLYKKQYPYAVTINTFINFLKNLWFGSYSRARGVLDSSGFEHVFIGELKKGEVSGLHHWFRFYYLEATRNKNKFHYLGYLVKRYNIMASVKFTWFGYYKKSGSFFITTSPEFDFFVYTLCFLFRRGNNGCKIEINGCPASITSYDLIQNGNIFIGTVFPNIGEMSDKCKLYNQFVKNNIH